jgi:hypothetical protein
MVCELQQVFPLRVIDAEIEGCQMGALGVSVISAYHFHRLEYPAECTSSPLFKPFGRIESVAWFTTLAGEGIIYLVIWQPRNDGKGADYTIVELSRALRHIPISIIEFERVKHGVK